LYGYTITVEIAKEICMVAGIAPRSNEETKKLSKKARKYFIECERIAKDKQQLNLPKDYLSALKALVESEEAKQKAISERNRLIHQNKLYTTTEIAKELGISSATKLNKILADKHIQYKQNGTWLLYSEYSDKNLVSIKQEILENDKIIYHRKWTGTGRDFILDLLNNF
jgi:phage antirepressor YoqD-like protein